MAKPTKIHVEMPHRDVYFDIPTESGTSIFAGVIDGEVKQWVLENVEKAMKGLFGNVLHQKDKKKFSSNIQEQLLLELQSGGSEAFIFYLIDVLVRFWPDDALSVFEKIDTQYKKVVANKINLEKLRIQNNR